MFKNILDDVKQYYEHDRPLSVRSKLFMSYGVGLLILLIVASVGLFSRSVLMDGLAEVESIATEIEEVNQISLRVADLIVPVNKYLISGDKNLKIVYEKKLKIVLKELDKLDETFNKEEEIVGELREKVLELNMIAKKVLSLPPPKESIASSLMYSIDLSSEESFKLIASHAREDGQKLRETLFKNENLLNTVNRTMLISAFLVLIIGIVFVYYLDNAIRLPLEGLSKTVKNLNKDKWEKIESSDLEEISELATEYNQMVDRLKDSYEELEDKVAERTKELNRANKKLEKLAVTDGLTGLFNHRHFYYILGEELERAKRYKHDLSVMIMDIDYFKNYNDTNGHPAGDRVLKKVSASLQKHVREVDVVCRYGGEEFTVVLPEIDKEGAFILAERLRVSIANEEYENEKAQPNGNLTISIGLAAFPLDGVTVEGLVNNADTALYNAKETGRNKVVNFGEEHTRKTKRETEEEKVATKSSVKEVKKDAKEVKKTKTPADADTEKKT